MIIPKKRVSLRIMPGNDDSDPLKGLLQGIKTTKDEVSQLHSEANHDN